MEYPTFVNFKKEADFEVKKAAGELNEKSIIFIDDTNKIVTHGVTFDGSEPLFVETIKYQTIFSEDFNNYTTFDDISSPYYGWVQIKRSNIGIFDANKLYKVVISDENDYYLETDCKHPLDASTTMITNSNERPSLQPSTWGDISIQLSNIYVKYNGSSPKLHITLSYVDESTTEKKYVKVTTSDGDSDELIMTQKAVYDNYASKAMIEELLEWGEY